MITELHLHRWKSFEKAQLYIDPLTVLIGLNAGGKSNVLDALLFLQRSVQQRDLFTALRGENEQTGVRGGLEWAVLRGNSDFQLQLKISTDDDTSDYYWYTLQVNIDAAHLTVNILEESLYKITHRKRADPSWRKIFNTEIAYTAQPFITAYTNNGRKGSKGTPHNLQRNVSVLSQLRYQNLNIEVKTSIATVIEHLENIFILDTVPQNMRGFPPLSNYLATDGSNTAGVLAALPPEQQKQVLRTLSTYTHNLPEREIQAIYVDKVGLLSNNAALRAEEKWLDGAIQNIDANGMSDGTLRFLAILTAILTRKKGSLLIIEEIDNGIHPSRAKLLIEILRTEGEKAGVDIVVTSHNTTFLNELGTAFIPFIVLAQRNEQTGYSQLTQVENLQYLPKILAKGAVGTLAANGYL